MSLEDDIRRQMEQDINAAFGFREYKKELRKEMPKAYNKRVAIRKGPISRKIGGKGIDVGTKKKHGM